MGLGVFELWGDRESLLWGDWGSFNFEGIALYRMARAYILRRLGVIEFWGGWESLNFEGVGSLWNLREVGVFELRGDRESMNFDGIGSLWTLRGLRFIVCFECLYFEGLGVFEFEGVVSLWIWGDWESLNIEGVVGSLDFEGIGSLWILRGYTFRMFLSAYIWGDWGSLNFEGSALYLMFRVLIFWGGWESLIFEGVGGLWILRGLGVFEFWGHCTLPYVSSAYILRGWESLNFEGVGGLWVLRGLHFIVCFWVLIFWGDWEPLSLRGLGVSSWQVV